MSLDITLIASVPMEVYDRNITHNLIEMAQAPNLFDACWRPDKLGATTASDITEPLRAGLELLESDPERFRAFNPENGWGDYEEFVNFIHSYLNACIANPDATIHISR